jgi:hypothetical protein
MILPKDLNDMLGMKDWVRRCAGIFLLSTATLMLQVAYTRVFSIALWYHFVWMIVSIALLGYAVSGTFLSIHPQPPGNLDKLLTYVSAAFSVSVIITYMLSNQIPFDPATMAWDSAQLLYISLYYLLLTIPFFLSGTALALAIEKSENRINIVYFSSFMGSAFGSVLVLPLFSPLGGPGVIVATSIIGAFSALSFSRKLGNRMNKPLAGLALALLILMPFSGSSMPVKISPYKSLNVALRYSDANHIETRWNAMSRVDVVDSGYVRYAPGLSLQYDAAIPEQIGIFVDGEGLNAITRYDGEPSTLSFTGYLPSTLPYRLVEKPSALVIDAGGGLGVLTALYFNSSKIYAVEENPLIVDLVRDEFSSFSGSIYSDEGVDVSVSDGRSFIETSEEKYGIIELSMTGGASAASTGIYALSENYLYTVESFTSFIEHLSEDGYLSVSRWLLPPPREDVRIVSLAVKSLESLGVLDPGEHIAVIRSWGTINLIVGKSPLTAQQTESIRGFCREMGFDIVHVPGVQASEVNIFNRFPEPIYYNIVHKLLDSEARESFYQGYLYDIEATTDEKPFFFNFFKWDRVAETYRSLDNKWQPLIEGGLLVPMVLIQALFFSIIFVLYPLRRLKTVESEDGAVLLAYFFFIGLGYMFIEITTVQRFILVLGSSIYSVSAVFFSLLLSSGLGSYYSSKINPGSREHKMILQALGTLSILYGLSAPLIRLTLEMTFSARLLITFITVMPLGFLMGMPFPLGIRLLSTSSKNYINWAWAANGAASVIGSVLPMMVALYFGFSRVYVLAGAMYLATLITMAWKRGTQTKSPVSN